MKQSLFGITSCLAMVAVCFATSEALALVGAHVELTGQSATGYTYTGTGFNGLPGTTSPDSRRRPKIYNDFASFDASVVGSTLTMTYDILLGGTADPGNESQDWRFGFVSTSANGGKGVSLGANLDIGNLAGTTAYEFFTDSAVTTGEGSPVSGEMDSAFTATLNNVIDGTARIAQSNADPFSDDVALNDRVDTSQITLSLERIANGYNLAMSWGNLTSGNVINHSTSITTADGDPSVALAAAVTDWDRLGFFINDNSLDADGSAYVYTMSNVGVDGNGSLLALASNWTPNAYNVPEPTTAVLMLVGVAVFGAARRKRS